MRDVPVFVVGRNCPSLCFFSYSKSVNSINLKSHTYFLNWNGFLSRPETGTEDPPPEILLTETNGPPKSSVVCKIVVLNTIPERRYIIGETEVSPTSDFRSVSPSVDVLTRGDFSYLCFESI